MTVAGAVSERREALRAAVLAAAERRVAATGLAELGVREVAQEAGCSAGMVYKLFPSHDELVLSVNARTLAALAEAMARRLDGVSDARAALAAMADAYLDYAIANTPRWDTLFAHRMAGGAALPEWYERRRDELFDGIAATLEGNDAALARTLFSAVHGVVALGLQQKVGASSPEALRAELRGLMEAIARGLFLAEPPVQAGGRLRTR